MSEQQYTIPNGYLKDEVLAEQHVEQTKQPEVVSDQEAHKLIGEIATYLTHEARPAMLHESKNRDDFVPAA